MISSAYTYYISQYSGNNREINRYTTHKKSELRDIYNSMVKVNRRSPLYKIEEPDEAHKYAIDLKEASAVLIDVAKSLSVQDNDKSGFISKQASSSDESVAVARYIGDDSEDSLKEYKLHVRRLASAQTNEGVFLENEGREFEVGSYSFDMNIGEYSYEFQFNVNNSDNNRSVQEKLTRLINRSNVGLKAKLVEEGDRTAMQLQSVNTGVSDRRESTFTITPNDNEHSEEVIHKLGLQKVVTEAANAEFTVNEAESSSMTNTFTINGEFEVNIRGISPDDKNTIIGFKADIDAVVDNLNHLLEGYNNIVEIAKDKNDGTFENSRLMRDLRGLSRVYGEYLESSGLKVDEEGRMTIDEALIVQSSEEGTLGETLDKFASLKNALLNKANSISINPINYVNKKLISYPNPIQNFSNPYVSSIYSGMMFDGYV